MITLNLPHGPDSTDMRYNHIKSAMGHLFASQSHNSCLLCQTHLGDILRETNELLPDDGHSSAEQRAWEWLRDHASFAKEGCKCNLNRFLSVIKEGLDLKARWTSYLFQCEFVALEMDMVGSRKLVDKIVEPAGGRDQGSTPTTSALATAIDERALRSVAQSALVVAMVFLSDYGNRRLLEIATGIHLPVLRWHIRMERETRNVSGASPWMVSQINGGVCEHCYSIFLSLSDESLLANTGLLDFNAHVNTDISEACILDDQEVAPMCGNMAVGLLAFRLCRCMWIVGCFLVVLVGLVTADESRVAGIIRRPKEGYEVYENLAKRDHPTVAMNMLLSRSPYNLVIVMQFVEAFKEPNWRMTNQVRQVLERRLTVAASTQIVEDLNNVITPPQKKNKKRPRPTR